MILKSFHYSLEPVRKLNDKLNKYSIHNTAIQRWHLPHQSTLLFNKFIPKEPTHRDTKTNSLKLSRLTAWIENIFESCLHYFQIAFNKYSIDPSQSWVHGKMLILITKHCDALWCIDNNWTTNSIQSIGSRSWRFSEITSQFLFVTSIELM